MVEDGQTTNDDLREGLRRALATLNPQSAEIFALRYFEDFTNREIAKALRISQVLVAVKLHRARHQLQKELLVLSGRAIMRQRELDQAIEEVRNEVVDDAVIRASAKRVFRGLFDSTLRSYQVDRIRGCADFRLLMKPYLSHTLSPARAMLLEDHTRQCVACRQALQAGAHRNTGCGVV